jgi:hypothetical protein
MPAADLGTCLFNRKANGLRETRSTQAVGLAVKQADSRRAQYVRQLLDNEPRP